MTILSGPSPTAADLVAIARAVAERSAERYGELAEAFAMSCNPATAQAFHAVAALYREQADALPPAPPPPRGAMDWFEHAPEIADPDSVHYLMLPWHVFDLAQRAEERVHGYYAALDNAAALAAASGANRDDLRARRDACPKPHPGWWEDEDGPNWDAD